MDVVTGGASAAYGSGAISGVNNIFLDRKLDGVKLEADFGQSMHQDARDRHVAAAFGTGFANDRGHVTLAWENQNSDELGCMKVRDWCARTATRSRTRRQARTARRWAAGLSIRRAVTCTGQ